MFARELASIEDLEGSEQGASGGVKALVLVANPFNDLFYSFFVSVSFFFVDIMQFSGPLLG